MAEKKEKETRPYSPEQLVEVLERVAKALERIADNGRKKQKDELAKTIAFAGAVTKIKCPICKVGQIIRAPEKWYGELWVCSNCNYIVNIEWLENKVKELRNGIL